MLPAPQLPEGQMFYPYDRMNLLPFPRSHAVIASRGCELPEYP